MKMVTCTENITNSTRLENILRIDMGQDRVSSKRIKLRIPKNGGTGNDENQVPDVQLAYVKLCICNMQFATSKGVKYFTLSYMNYQARTRTVMTRMTTFTVHPPHTHHNGTPLIINSPQS